MGGEELVGPAPEGWEYTSLGTACARGGGDIQTGPFGSQLHAADYVPVGIPSIMPQNIGDNRIVEDGIARITPEDAKRLNRYLVRQGDIVYSRRGDVERRSLVRKHEDGWLCGTGCLRVRLGDQGPDPRFATYYLGHPSVREWIVRHAHGATMPNLNTSILGSCPFVVPPPGDQRAIAHILGTLDDKIELNRRMSETLEAMARALFTSWFVDFDPVRAKAAGRDPGLPKEIADLFPDSFEESELGEIPKGWGVGTFNDVVDMLREQINPQANPEESFHHYSLPAYDDGKAPVVEVGAGIKSNKFVVPPDAVLMSKLNPTIERVWLVDVGGTDRAIASTEFLVLRPRAPYGVACTYCLTRDASFRRQVQELVTGTSNSHQRAQAGQILGLQRILPPQAVGSEFESAADPLLERVKVMRRESRTLAALRDVLLPQLLSGALQVPSVQGAGAQL